MRPIKFRGKRIDNGEWVYGYFLKRTICDGEGECSYIKFDGNGGIRVLPETVGQFTGLHDKNGKEIYEGDKLRWIYESHHLRGGKVEDIIEVKWINSGWHLGINEIYEVIGNIHERSET